MPSSLLEARAIALQTLYEADLVRHPAGTVLERHVRSTESSQEVTSSAQHLVAGVVTNLEAIDEILQEAAPAWPLAQLPGVDKALLRLAIFETVFDNSAAPVMAAINEAVNLAKTFGSESSPKFVSGVMGTVVARDEPRQ